MTKRRPLVEQVTTLFFFRTRRRYLKAVPTVGATCRSSVLATCPLVFVSRLVPLCHQNNIKPSAAAAAASVD